MFFGADDALDPGPFFCQPDPEKAFFVPAHPKRLVRRGPRQYFLVGRKPDGSEVEVRVTSVTFGWDGTR